MLIFDLKVLNLKNAQLINYAFNSLLYHNIWPDFVVPRRRDFPQQSQPCTALLNSAQRENATARCDK